MTVSTIASVATGISRVSDTQNTQTPSTVNTGATVASSREDVVTYPTELQKQGASLRVAAQSISRTGSQLDAAGAGASQITSLLSQLQGIATQVSLGGLTDTQRNALNAEFQSLRQQINDVATGGSSVDGASLIANNQASTAATSAQPTTANAANANAVTTAAANAAATNAKIGGLTDTDLFGPNSTVNVATQTDAQAATTAVTAAQTYVAAQVETITATKVAVDYAASTVESALQNQEAARSTLSDSDFTSPSSGTTQARIQSQPSDAVLAQTSRLPADILQLLSD